MLLRNYHKTQNNFVHKLPNSLRNNELYYIYPIHKLSNKKTRKAFSCYDTFGGGILIVAT